MTARHVDATDKDKIRVYASSFYSYALSLKSKPSIAFAEFGCILNSFETFAKDGALYEFVTDAGHVVGIVCAYVVEPWYSKKTTLEEVFVLCIDPMFKGFGRVAMKFLKNKARELGCACLVTGNFLTDNPKQVENLYQNHGHCLFSYKNFCWAFIT